MNYISDDIIEINIKNLNDKYEIYFNKCLYVTNIVKTYEGKNIITKEKIIIDIYNNDIIFLAKRLSNKIINIEHPNIINILDIIIQNNIYIIKPYLNNIIIDNNTYLFNTCKQIIIGIKYIFDKNIDIETLTINNIYYDSNDNLIKVSPVFRNTNQTKKILYGSPLLSPPEIINKNDKEDIIINNIYNIISILISKKYNNILDCDFLEILSIILDTKKKCSLNDIYIYFNGYKIKKNKYIKDNCNCNYNSNCNCNGNDNIFILDL